MGIIKGSVASRQVQIQWQDGELEKYKKICETNNLNSVDDVCHYYEKQGVVIDYGCPNRWPVGGPKAKQNEYFECKAAYYENTGTSPGGGGSGSCSSSKASDDAAQGQESSNGNNQASNNQNSESIADKAQSVAKNAAENAAKKADELMGQAKDMAQGAMDKANSLLGQANALSKGASALAATALSKAGMFSLPNVQIPKFELPDINSYIQNIVETYKPDQVLNSEINVLKDQLSSIEDIRNKLEGTRLGEMAKELAENAGLENQYLDKLKSLGGEMDKVFDNATSMVDSAINNANDAAASASNMAESLAAAAEAAANGESMSADTIANMVDSLSDAASDADSTMKGVFGDESGKAAEAVAEADTANEVPKRGNGPCGGKTKDVGGVNHNEPDKEKEEEDANLKAYYLKQFEDACNAGNMNEVERLYDILVNQYGESPALLKNSLAKIQTTAPQTKAGIQRVSDILEDATEKVKESNQDTLSKSWPFGKDDSSDKASTVGDGNPYTFTNKVNMNKKLQESKDESEKIKAASDFANDNLNAQGVEAKSNEIPKEEQERIIANYKNSINDSAKKAQERLTANDYTKDAIGRAQKKADQLKVDFNESLKTASDSDFVVTRNGTKTILSYNGKMSGM